MTKCLESQHLHRPTISQRCRHEVWDGGNWFGTKGGANGWMQFLCVVRAKE
jgi:hypothetical protein